MDNASSKSVHRFTRMAWWVFTLLAPSHSEITFKLTAAENEDPGDMVYASDFEEEPGGVGWIDLAETGA